jgi:hypothetical protein
VLPMRKSLAALLLGVPFGLPRQGDAQEVASDTPKETPGRYFSKPVDLWKTGRSLAPTPQHVDSSDTAPERVAVRDNVWAQPIRTPDGNWMIYVPPKQVLDFLEAPSEATARVYLSWKAEQSQKLRHAMTLLAKLKNATEAPLEASNEAAAKPAPQDFPFRITYFKKPSCPHCVSQDAVLSEWLARRTSGKVDVVLPGERPELWKAYQVRGTPTLLLEAGSSGRKELLVGLQSEAALEANLAKLAFPPADPATDTRKEPAR